MFQMWVDVVFIKNVKLSFSIQLQFLSLSIPDQADIDCDKWLNLKRPVTTYKVTKFGHHHSRKKQSKFIYKTSQNLIWQTSDPDYFIFEVVWSVDEIFATSQNTCYLVRISKLSFTFVHLDIWIKENWNLKWILTWSKRKNHWPNVPYILQLFYSKLKVLLLCIACILHCFYIYLILELK